MKEESTSVLVESRMEHRPVPKHWGESELTKFLALLEEQTLASFACLPDWFGILVRIDQSVTEQAPNFFHEIDPPRRTSVKLFMRCFATYRATVRLSVSGQLFEATVLMRSLLESAAYAWICYVSEQHRKAWEDRGNGAEERKRSRQIFSWSDLLKTLASTDANLSARISDQYDHLIDHGAHPNVNGLELSADVKEIGHNKYEIVTVFAHGRDAVLLAVLDLVRCMHYVCQLLYMVIKERLEILGLDAEFKKTSALISQLIDKLEAEQHAKNV